MLEDSFMLEDSYMLIDARKIVKRFYTPTEIKILDGVDLQIEKGDLVAITGRSGEGKSTLLHILGTIEDYCSGSLSIDGKEVSLSSKLELRRKAIGFIFQAFHLLEDFTVLENILFPAKILRERVDPKSENYARAHDLLKRVGLDSRASFLAKLLSGGEKQRCAIARALCNRPKILFADEPSGNLDGHTAEIIHELLLQLVKDEGMALVLVTHNTQLARLCKKQYVLSSGKLVNL